MWTEVQHEVEHCFTIYKGSGAVQLWEYQGNNVGNVEVQNEPSRPSIAKPEMVQDSTRDCSDIKKIPTLWESIIHLRLLCRSVAYWPWCHCGRHNSNKPKQEREKHIDAESSLQLCKSTPVLSEMIGRNWFCNTPRALEKCIGNISSRTSKCDFGNRGNVDVIKF